MDNERTHGEEGIKGFKSSTHIRQLGSRKK